MKRVSAEIVAQRLPEFLAEVLAGEEIELTRDGQSIARLVRMQPTLPTTGANESAPLGFAEEPTIGMWADRDDMRDAAQWVAHQRDLDWNRVP
jgi:antitoxin (DNA-binding transcriptional repressor) of toxin-antitoxin stability system